MGGRCSSGPEHIVPTPQSRSSRSLSLVRPLADLIAMVNGRNIPSSKNRKRVMLEVPFRGRTSFSLPCGHQALLKEVVVSTTPCPSRSLPVHAISTNRRNERGNFFAPSRFCLVRTPACRTHEPRFASGHPALAIRPTYSRLSP